MIYNRIAFFYLFLRIPSYNYKGLMNIKTMSKTVFNLCLIVLFKRSVKNFNTLFSAARARPPNTRNFDASRRWCHQWSNPPPVATVVFWSFECGWPCQGSVRDLNCLWGLCSYRVHVWLLWSLLSAKTLLGRCE